MYFLAGVSYRQMNDIHIAPEDYEPGGLLYNENTITKALALCPSAVTVALQPATRVSRLPATTMGRDTA
jgi:hypothetical protein